MVAQQPKRPKVEDVVPRVEGAVDVKQMYSTSAGNASAKPFSELSGVLDKALLDGLDKMGFE
jgi:ATP-dependent RNA helicase MSS116